MLGTHCSTGLAARGRMAPRRRALLQFLEGRADRQAADAVRARIDWEYVARRAAARPHPRVPLRPPRGLTTDFADRVRVRSAPAAGRRVRTGCPAAGPGPVWARDRSGEAGGRPAVRHPGGPPGAASPRSWSWCPVPASRLPLVVARHYRERQCPDRLGASTWGWGAAWRLYDPRASRARSSSSQWRTTTVSGAGPAVAPIMTKCRPSRVTS